MSLKKLLNDNDLTVLFDEYHLFISNNKKNGSTPQLKFFFEQLKRKHNQFSTYKDKQLSNQIIASRNKFGSLLWPNLDDLQNYISPLAQNFLDKSVKAALLAVEIYNKPTIDYRTEGYIVMMNIAWTSLFHAIFSNNSIPYTYKIKGSKDIRYLELGKSLSKYNGPLQVVIKANLDFLSELRDLIEHRIIPELDDKVFGECQACLFNYEQLLRENFRSNYQLSNSLAYSLQFSDRYSSEQLMAKKSYDLKTYNSVMQFIDDYRNNLAPEVFQSIHYSFRVFMIPKIGNHVESSDLAVEFIKYDPNNEVENESYENLLVLIRDKRVPGEFLRAGEVAKLVFEKLKSSKPLNWKFSASFHHAKCTKYFKIRVGHYSGEPEKTESKFCIYDPTFGQHIYKKEWVEFLFNKLQDDSLYNKIMKSK